VENSTLSLTEKSQLLTTDEAAELLRVSVPQMMTWRRKGKGPSFLKLNNSVVRYRMGELVAYQDAHVQEVAQ
jgi:hypothetical protein